MQEDQSKQYSINDDNEIDLREFFDVLLAGKWIIIFFTVLIFISGIVFSLRLPNIYESKALLVPTSSSNNISKSLVNYSNLAGLAGINLPTNVEDDNSSKAFQKISSLSLFENNIINNIFLPDLMAVKSWIPESNTIVYDSSIYNIDKESWVRDFSYPQKQVPSAQESYKVFLTEHLKLSQDNQTGFITLSVRHQSPFIAKQWAELIIDEVNNFYRQKDKTESERAVSYLNKQISMTGLSEIKNVMAQLLQEETKKLTLIEANRSYVFDYIDPPAVMEKKSGPKRSIICLLSGLLGAIFSIIFVLIRHYSFKKNIHK